MFAFTLDAQEVLCVWLLFGEVSDAEYEAYVATFAEVDDIAARNRQVRGVGILVCAEDSTSPNAKWRKKIADASADLKSNPYVIFAMPTALMRGVVTAVNWIRPPPYDWKMVAKFDEAVACAQLIRPGSAMILRRLYDEAMRKTA